jgi:outer membrane protein insertion porin family
LSAEVAGANIIGTTNFYKLGFKSEAYKSLDNSGSVVLASLFDIESISSLSGDNYVPPNELLFMGGNGLAYNTVALRGYDDRTVGPVNRIGSPIGGRFLMKYGVELRYSLSQDPIPIFLTAFAEAGNVWASFRQADFLDLKRSVGFGARLVLPAVGIIGFDLGYGFDRKIVNGEDPAWLFHFQFGRGF